MTGVVKAVAHGASPRQNHAGYLPTRANSVDVASTTVRTGGGGVTEVRFRACSSPVPAAPGPVAAGHRVLRERRPAAEGARHLPRTRPHRGPLALAGVEDLAGVEGAAHRGLQR